MLLAALLSTTNAAITTDSGTYDTAADLSASQAVSTKVKEIVSLLDGTQAGIDSAKAKYLDGYPADAGNLKTLAEGVCSTCTEGTTCASVKAVYPSVSCFLTDYIEGASSIIDDTSLNVEARSQWFRVAIQDGIPVQLAISYMELATASAAASDWDKAAAVLLGTDADRGYAVYGRADGLARDYGTLDGADSEHNNALHSKANEKILDALEAGRTGGAGAYATQTANVIAQLKVIYAQATLRSTWGVEENLVAGTSHDKNQARGLAYFGFVLVPYVKEIDTVHEKHADMISDFFDIGFSPESFDRKEYCRVLDAMEDTLNEHSANLYADFGALTAAAAVTCPATHIPGRLNLVTDAGSYWPLSDVAGSLSYSTAMKDIEAMTDEAAIESQYAAIKTEYQKKGLRAEATKDRAGEPVWDMFKTQTGSGTWITDFMDSALDGTIPGVRSNDARRELVEKTAKDAASVQAVISDLYKATTATPGTDASVDRYWDHGAAKYVGNTLDRGSTIYGRADKRGKNFEAVDGSDVAFTNIVVLRALEVGRDATTTQEREAQYDIIVKQIQVIYAQCALRYARLIDEALLYDSKLEDLPKYRAEGRAFWNIISPWLRAKAGSLTDSVQTKVWDLDVDLEKDVHAFCRVYELIEMLELPEWEMGTLVAAAGVTCVGDRQTADTKPPTVPLPGGGGGGNSKRHDELVGGLVGFFIGMFFACAFGFWACWRVRQEKQGMVKLIQNAGGGRTEMAVEMAGEPKPSPNNV